MFAASRRVWAAWPVEIAKGKALFMALRLDGRFALQDVILESDSNMIISRLSRAMIYFSDLDSILEDVLLLSSRFNSVFWSHVKRDDNVVPHHLAKLVFFGVEQIGKNHCLAEVNSYVVMDIMSLN